MASNELALFFEQGTGKTATAINIYRAKCNANGRYLKTLVVCPLIVCQNWKREFALHSSMANNVFVLEGSGTKRVQQFLKHNSTHKIFVMNYESLQMPTLMAAIAFWGVEFLIVDEAHRVKNPQAARTKVLTDFSKNVKYKYILTGTPILNSPMDIFSPFKIMRPDAFGDNFFIFRKRFFYDANANKSWATWPDWKFQTEKEAEFSRIIAQHSVKAVKSECLDLPPLVKQRVDVAMSPEQAKVYKQMARDFVAWFDEKNVTMATIALTKVLRLQQIMAGFIRNDEGVDISFEKVPRLDALGELLADICVGSKAKVIVWSCFVYNYKQIYQLCDELKLKSVGITGIQTSSEKQASIDAFQNDSEVQVCIANPAAGGVGINLTAASYAIFYARSYNLEHDLQAEARNYRGGSEVHKSITRIDLVTPDSIDELILEALANKQNIADNLLQIKKKLID